MLTCQCATTMRAAAAFVAVLLAGEVARAQVREDSTNFTDSSSVVLNDRTIETRVSTQGFRIAVYNADGELFRSSSLIGKIHLDVGKKSYDFKLVPVANASLGADVDLSRAVGYELRIAVELEGLHQKTMNYAAIFRLSSLLSDSFLLKLQRRCPVSGKELQATDNQQKLVFEGRPLFVCCDGCAAVVNRDPQKYLDQLYSESPRESRPGVYEATLADAEAIARQERCPVLDERLDLVGVPLKVTVDGKSVFVACLGCAKFVQSEPEKYITKLAQKNEQIPLQR